MAKKSSNRRNPASSARNAALTKPQASGVTLVRAPGTDTGASSPAASTPATAITAKATGPAAASIVRDTGVKPAAPAPKPVAKPAPKPAAATKTATSAQTPTRQTSATPTKAATPATSAKRQDTRVARARATQRARQAGLISAESYSYVLGDLKLIAVMAVAAFAVLIGLAIFLPH